MPIDPFAALNAMLRAEAARISPAPAPTERTEPEPEEEQGEPSPDRRGR
ncbi:hypothetical protein ACFWXK_33435 [Streptomyces sp. NPDC059070]